MTPSNRAPLPSLPVRDPDGEVENAQTGRALAEARAQSGALTEQLLVQRQLLRELETQLHESQRSCTQLRTQVDPPQGTPPPPPRPDDSPPRPLHGPLSVGRGDGLWGCPSGPRRPLTSDLLSLELIGN